MCWTLDSKDCLYTQYAEILSSVMFYRYLIDGLLTLSRQICTSERRWLVLSWWPPQIVSQAVLMIQGRRSVTKLKKLIKCFLVWLKEKFPLGGSNVSNAQIWTFYGGTRAAFSRLKFRLNRGKIWWEIWKAAHFHAITVSFWAAPPIGDEVL